MPLIEKTSAYGDAFEHLIILEILRLASYFEPEYRFSYIRTPSDAKVSLIVERLGQPHLCIEIKSTTEVERTDLSAFIRLTKDFGGCEAICLSRDLYLKKIEYISCIHWLEGIKNLLQKHSKFQLFFYFELIELPEVKCQLEECRAF